MKTPTVKDITPAMKSAVNTLLLAMAFERMKREQVDAIEREVLLEAPLKLADDELARGDHASPYITDPKDVWLADLERAEYKEHAVTVNQRERAAGVKPPDMADEYCPALVARQLVTTAQRVLVELTGPLFGVTWDKLCRYLPGHKKMALDEYCDLWIGLVVNMPGYEKPKLQL